MSNSKSQTGRVQPLVGPVRRLPDFVGVASDCGEFFLPGECQPGEVVVRRGRIMYRGKFPVDCVIGHARDMGILSFRVVAFVDEKWKLMKGLVPGIEAVMDAIGEVIGCDCP